MPPPVRRSLPQPSLPPTPVRRASLLQPPRTPLVTRDQQQRWDEQQQQEQQHIIASQQLQQLQQRQSSAPRQQSSQFGERFPTYAPRLPPPAPEHDPYDYLTWSAAEAEQYHIAASNLQQGSEWRVFYESAYAAWYDNMYPNWQVQAYRRQS
ncbi:MAG: hypothetical protein WDW36_002654 [Sanguina aurantia]